LWVVNAPTYGLNSNNTIENFVNKYMTYDIDGQAPNLYEAQHIVTKTFVRKKSSYLSFKVSMAETKEKTTNS
jgi:hypothetical protein